MKRSNNTPEDLPNMLIRAWDIEWRACSGFPHKKRGTKKGRPVRIPFYRILSYFCKLRIFPIRLDKGWIRTQFDEDVFLACSLSQYFKFQKVVLTKGFTIQLPERVLLCFFSPESKKYFFRFSTTCSVS